MGRGKTFPVGRDLQFLLSLLDDSRPLVHYRCFLVGGGYAARCGECRPPEAAVEIAGLPVACFIIEGQCAESSMFTMLPASTLSKPGPEQSTEIKESGAELDQRFRLVRSSARLPQGKRGARAIGGCFALLSASSQEWLAEVLPKSHVFVANTVIGLLAARKMGWHRDEYFTVSTMHADLDSQERQLIMREFKSGSSRVLVSTDLLARGIDVQQVSLVINYDLPFHNKIENYLHRIGRSGRFGRKGTAINFVTSKDVRTMKDIERFYHTQIEELPMNIADLV